MFFKKKFLAVLALFLCGCNAQSSDDVADSIKKKIDDGLQVEVTNVTKTPFKDLYQLEVGGHLLYTNKDADYVFAGSLIDYKNQRNITQEEMTKVGGIDNFDELPLDNAVKQVIGNGKHKVAVFEDPDCFYCKKFTRSLSKLDDVTLYIYLIPIISDKSEGHIKRVLCASDPLKVWMDWMVDDRELPEEECDMADQTIQANLDLAKKLKVTGTPAFFFENGRHIEGFMQTDHFNKIMKLPAEKKKTDDKAESDK